MVYGLGLGAGLKALTAAQLGIQTAGNNVANANTPGYSRQRVQFASALPYAIGRGFQIGTGVDVTDISRIVDQGLERRIRLQLGLFGGAEIDHMRFQELEGIFNEPNGGLSEGLSQFFGSINKLQTDPADRALRGGVVQSGNGLADGFRMLSRRFQDLRDSTFEEVRGLIRQVNELADSVAQLNAQITSVEANGSTANDLRDSREQKVKDIAKLLDTNAIERGSGSLDLLVGGHLLVAGDRVSHLSVTKAESGETKVTVPGAGNDNRVTIHEGRIAALLRQEARNLPEINDRVDRLARNMILEFNRLHTTGVPRNDPFTSLTSFYGAQDRDGDGMRGDELLSQAGFRYDVQKGELSVSVSDLATGDVERMRVAVDPSSMSLLDLANELNDIEHITASVDPAGRLRINADNGYGYDFSTRIDPQPDTFGSFGGANPSIATPSAGPFDLSSNTFPATFDVVTGTAAAPVTTTVTLDANEFVNPGAATVDELVAALDADLGNAATAANVGGRLVIRSNVGGDPSQMRLQDTGGGTVIADLGMTTSIVTGQDARVKVTAEGVYTGSANDQLTFVPTMDGEIGVTDNLQIEVFDQNGRSKGTFNIGEGYTPGDTLDIGDGVKLSFGPGAVSQTSGNAFTLDTLADSDTSDVLVALGMNSFFHGSGAADIEVNPELQSNPDLLTAGLSNASGDASNLVRMIELRGSRLADLSSGTIEDFYTDLVGDLGFETASAELTLQSQDTLLTHLQQERESLSGVNLDEEMVDMVRYQQAYDAAARYIATVQELSQTLINIGR